jgi:glucose-6-phosphate-specific signal transduction histidine kinase
MNHAATLNPALTTPDTATGLPDFHALGLAGSINLLTTGLRENGTSIEWQTPHHGMEINTGTAALLYRAAAQVLDAILARATATHVTVRLAAVYHGIRLTIEDSAGPVPAGQPATIGQALLTAVDLAGGSVGTGFGSASTNQVSITLPLD